MKKAITILAIIAIVAGALFATSETHTVRIKADVNVIKPVFGLMMDGDTYKTNTATLDGDTDYTGDYTTEFGRNASYGMTGEENDNDNALAVSFKLDQGGTVTFNAVLLNNAKEISQYDLTFGDGVFTVSKNGRPNQQHGPSSVEVTAGSDITGLDIADGDDAGDYDKKVNLDFDGKAISGVTNAAPKTLATAVYTYPEDLTIDALADDEFYYADVTLTVATR
jgi:hypothetical protein